MGGMTALFFKVIPLMVIGANRCGNCMHASFAIIIKHCGMMEESIRKTVLYVNEI
jgi:hypothetical protein